MTPTAASVEEAHKLIKSLIATKIRYLVPMTLIFMVSYIGLTILAGFAKGIMALRFAGAFNLGFLLIALNYVLSWVLAVVYIRVANTVFDPSARKALSALTGQGSSI
jgi:uncharacterized membrane protein (DUF485 family)